MVIQNKIFSFKIKRQAKDVFLSDLERTVAYYSSIFLSTGSFYLCHRKIKYIIKYSKWCVHTKNIKYVNYDIFISLPILIKFAPGCPFSIADKLHFVGLSLLLFKIYLNFIPSSFSINVSGSLGLPSKVF